VREQGLRARARKRRKCTTRPGKRRWRAPDLVGRDFRASMVNHKWYGDGTELPTDEGKLFLDSVLDMASRRIVAFAMDAHHDAALAHAALAMAVAIRGGNQAIAWVVMHTDQGSEHTAGMFRQACTRMGIKQSMGSAGSALDNAVIGSWHSIFEFELRGLERFAPVGVSATLRRRVGTRRAAARRLAARPCSTGHAARPTTRRSRRRQQTRKSMEGATMPPHCDSLDGPVVTAARRALDAGNVDLVLPFVHARARRRCDPCSSGRSPCAISARQPA
jgi:hypothetical protein